MTVEQFLHQEIERAPRGFVSRVMHSLVEKNHYEKIADGKYRTIRLPDTTIAELRAMTRSEMMRTPNLGVKAVDHLRYLLDKYPESPGYQAWGELADRDVLPL